MEIDEIPLNPRGYGRNLAAMLRAADLRPVALLTNWSRRRHERRPFSLNLRIFIFNQLYYTKMDNIRFHTFLMRFKL